MLDINNLKRFRTFGECGPTYEVLEVLDEESVKIMIYPSCEEHIYSIKEMLNDPLERGLD
jgi:hypothetical protein